MTCSTTLKRKAQSAWVEDLGPDTEEVLENSRRSSSIFEAIESSRARRNARRSQDKDEITFFQPSEKLGSMVDYLTKHAGDEEVLTILVANHEDNTQVWEHCKTAMKNCNCRIFCYDDEIINRESSTFIERELLVSKADDIDFRNSSVIIAQRTYLAPHNTLELVAHKLSFGGRINLDRRYIFDRLGDEIPGVKTPELHCTFRAVEQWNRHLRSGQFGGFDQEAEVRVSAEDVRTNRRVVYDIENKKVVRVGGKDVVERLVMGVGIEAGDLAPLMESEGKGETVARKRPRKSLCVSLIGVGEWIEGLGLRADVNVSFSVG